MPAMVFKQFGNVRRVICGYLVEECGSMNIISTMALNFSAHVIYKIYMVQCGGGG